MSTSPLVLKSGSFAFWILGIRYIRDTVNLQGIFYPRRWKGFNYYVPFLNFNILSNSYENKDWTLQGKKHQGLDPKCQGKTKKLINFLWEVYHLIATLSQEGDVQCYNNMTFRLSDHMEAARRKKRHMEAKIKQRVTLGISMGVRIKS